MTTRARWLALLLLAACPGGGGDDTSGGTATTGSDTATNGPPTTGEVMAPEEIDRLCAHIFSCGCEPAGFSSEAACRADLVSQVDTMRMLAEQSGLVYDESCFTAEVDHNIDFVQCHTQDELRKLPKACRYCDALRGDKAAGEACSKKLGDYADCGPGLKCDSGLCVDPCNPLGAGETCTTADYQKLGDCAEGLYCTADRICQPHAQAGESCDGNICAEGLGCDEAAPGGPVCGPEGELGEPCTHGCGEGLTCDLGTEQCIALPGEGEGCVYGLCSQGLTCDSDVCKSPPGPGDPCPYGGCPDPTLRCSEAKICEPRLPAGSPCASLDDCADNTTCAGGTCQPQAPVFCVQP